MDDNAPPDQDNTNPVAAHVAVIEGKSVVQQTITKIIDLSKRDIVIVIPELNDLFDSAETLQAITNFLRESNKRELRILLNTLDPQLAPDSDLIKLFQRLPSRIELKQVSSMLEAPIKPKDVLLIADKKHTLRVDNLTSFHAWVDLEHEARAKKYLESINQQWQYAQEVAEFRQFLI